jgi:hypothetical protein
LWKNVSADKAFTALWLSAQKANRSGISEPVVLYSSGIDASAYGGHAPPLADCPILRAGKKIVTILQYENKRKTTAGKRKQTGWVTCCAGSG